MARKLRRIRSPSRQRGNPWTKAVLFSLASLTILVLISLFGLNSLVKLSLFLESFSQPALEVQPLKPKQSRSLSPTLYPPPLATKTDQIDIRGLARPGQQIRLYQNGNRLGDIIATKSGEFVFTNLSLVKGENNFYAVAVDEFGEETAYSQSYSVVFLDQPPTLQISAPENGSTFRGDDQAITIQGKVDPDITVTVNNHLVITQPSGEFNYPVELSPGENQYLIIAKDLAGNETEQKLTVNYQPD